jgi:hypothetical protein
MTFSFVIVLLPHDRATETIWSCRRHRPLSEGGFEASITKIALHFCVNDHASAPIVSLSITSPGHSS